MECNREEALKARDIAEKKMELKDFVAAHRFALKAQQLQANLENISQMLIVCEVHCAAEKKIFGNENDWYDILQIQMTADEAAIKKQYKKLALQLHPDKNKLPGAESAFKLIGEAQVLLLDQTKRRLYDKKRVSYTQNKKKPAQNQSRSNHQTNGNSRVQKEYNFNFGVNPQFHQTGHFSNGQNSSANRPMFWAMCPFCRTKHHYFIEIINKYVECLVCKKYFMAFQILQETSAPTNIYGAYFAQTNNVSSSRDFKTEPVTQNVKSNGVSAEVKVTEKPKQDGKMESGNQNCKSKTEQCSDSDNVQKKRKLEDSSSSESVEDGSDESEEELSTEKDDFIVNVDVESRDRPRRSSRSKQQVSYKETQSDRDSENSEDSEDLNVEQQNAKSSDDINDSVEKPSKSGSDSPSEMNLNGEESSPKLYHAPDPEFHDFEALRNEKSFARGQIWALYDEYDAMPRIYAKVMDVLKLNFKLKMRWLEQLPNDEDEHEWMDEDLPVPCGTFRFGKTEINEDLKSFSHLVHCEKGSRKNTLTIYPRKDEIWAIYKNPKANGKSAEDSNKQFDYEFVKVLSNYSEENGVCVSYLTKVMGFVSLFKEETKDMKNEFCPEDIRRFSHMVPSFVMTGNERDGVPPGCFELDPASLPL